MIVLGAALAGALLGGFTAKRRGGAAADIAQYAAATGIIFTLFGVLATIAIHRYSV